MRWLLLLLLILTLGLILLGGIVHSSGSSLACPDWPLCYGQVFPEMKGGVAIEHSHRLLATSIGLLTILLVLVAGRRRTQDPVSYRLAWLALGLVAGQGLLGGITVLYRLPTIISTAHLATSMLFFATLLWIMLRNFFGPIPAAALYRRNQVWIRISLIVLYLQIVLGGLVRHTGAGLACPDIPFCYGSWWPTGLHVMSQLQMAHRYGAVLTALFVVASVFFLLCDERRDKRADFFVLNAVLLLVLQIGLGFLSVWARLAMTVVTAHLAGAALLLATLVVLCYLARSPPRLQ